MTTFFKIKSKVIHSDGGGEYIGTEFTKHMDQQSVQYQRTASYSLQQNGVAERKNHTLVKMACCMLLDANLDYIFWGEAVITANYIQNRLSAKEIMNTPYFGL